MRFTCASLASFHHDSAEGVCVGLMLTRAIILVQIVNVLTLSKHLVNQSTKLNVSVQLNGCVLLSWQYLSTFFLMIPFLALNTQKCVEMNLLLNNLTQIRNVNSRNCCFGSITNA